MVEKYLLQSSFLHPAACSISSTVNSSWKDIRPIRATESRLVSASADTHIVMKHCAPYTGMPNISRNPATPEEKIANGVPTAAVPSAEAAAPATQRARTASRLSRTIAPYPTFCISFSFAMVFEEVPDDTRLWNPETAPQATVTNRIGNRSPDAALWKPVYIGRFIFGCATTSPTTAPRIMPANIKVVIKSRGCIRSHIGRTAARKM